MENPNIQISDDARPLEREVGHLLIAGDRETAIQRLQEEYERLAPVLEHDEGEYDAA